MKKMFLMAIVAAASVSFGGELINRVGQQVYFNCAKQNHFFDKCVAENCSNIKEAAKEIECRDECVNKTLQIDCGSN